MAALIATATIGLVVVLWWAATAGLSGAELVNARFNALRTGLSIGVGGGGIFALYLAWRRQHATEIGLVQKERDQADVARAYELQRETAEHTRLHAERVAATTERDAEARRITDLYARSVEQLGSDKAPVRHGGLYALERLALDHPDNLALRQTVVNVICAYLRAPFDLPGEPRDADTDRPVRDERHEQVQEREVRLTAQRILTSHLYSGSDDDYLAATFWPDTDLDLTGAVLIDWDMKDCLLRKATFKRTIFAGHAIFSGTTFTGNVQFSGAMFSDDALFGRATFTRNVQFNGTAFNGGARFDGAKFIMHAGFSEATFAEGALFEGATFTGKALFNKARFSGDAQFGGVKFITYVEFNEVMFAGNALFWGVAVEDAYFNGAAFSEDVRFDEANFIRETQFKGATLRHAPPGPRAVLWWPTRWRPSLDHTAIEGREGTWHRLLGRGETDEPASPSDDG
ncbi:pentapeptide repeat-containing protein [Saccharothrix luteola]|uniref:pentapeptide repeat-containing protein n=1 Tax=Saccharothrix luteola TaxID=2893018 RepID=UPI001E4C4C67|nr:pentapeptide repeat-containing protein [Saccharothrix luteola]MCC8246695.1 pentapeptide repeat-containing protein [Saccharothrix luteola]